MNQKAYEFLRKLVSVILPAVATFLAAINAGWNLGWPMDGILATFTAVETLLGTIFLGSKYVNDKKVGK